MIIKNIEITNFRNYDYLKIEFGKNINIVYGNNGSGKTNLLESVYVLGFTKSHKFFIDNNLIKDNNDYTIVKGTILNNIPYELEVLLNKTTKQVKIDNNVVKKISDYIDKTNIVVFYTEDLDLIKGTPSVRRKYLDMSLCQISINYYNAINDFNKLLKTRNEYLKKIGEGQKIDFNYFNVLTNYFINKSVFIYQMREKLFERLNNICPSIFERLTGKNGFKIEYKPSIGIDSYSKDNLYSTLKKTLEDNFEKEIKFKSTLYGPHRDDFEFCLNELNLKNFGSQGQQRLAVIALKLSEIHILKDYKETNPIVLLDDIFSELDNTKKERLLSYISGDIQVIITTTDLNNIDKSLLDNAKLIHIDKGNVLKGEMNNE